LNNLPAKVRGLRVIDIQASGQRISQQSFKHRRKNGFHRKDAKYAEFYFFTLSSVGPQRLCG
jgi:hypothetical protein